MQHKIKENLKSESKTNRRSKMKIKREKKQYKINNNDIIR